jgi:hypothetical protein
METSTVLVLLLTGVMSLAGIVASTRALVHDGYRATPTRTSGPAFARDLERTSVRGLRQAGAPRPERPPSCG